MYLIFKFTLTFKLVTGGKYNEIVNMISLIAALNIYGVAEAGVNQADDRFIVSHD